jgi:glycosyltransferase involved in cell wall biosynthesis
MGERARRRVEENFTWARIARQTLDLIEQHR